MKVISILLTILFLSSSISAQSLFNEFSDSEDTAVPTYDLVTERIVRVSQSKRIFLITNNQESFAKGDFVTLLIQEKPITRGLVAKTKSGTSAIKITKTYSIELFNALRSGQDVQVIRGDDSFYRKKKPKSEEDQFKINESEDLYDDTTILEEDMMDTQRNKKEAIKNDNVVSFNYALVDGFNEAGEEDKNDQLNITWAYQLETNIWIEGLFGRHLIKDYPSTSIDTEVYNYTVRAKYAIKGPLFTIFMPYVGFQVLDASSPGAGNDAESTDAAQEELAKVENLKEKGLVFGVTGLKRLVPGWFIKGELGTDLMAIGLALEF